jgi:hypothetical protein
MECMVKLKIKSCAQKYDSFHCPCFLCGLDCYSYCLVISWFELMSYSVCFCSKLLDSHYLRTKKLFWVKSFGL